MAKKSTKPESDEQFAERVELRMSALEKERFQEAAKRQGLTLSQWIRFACRSIVVEHGGKIKLVELE